jgi:hypothetical protein
MTEKRFAEQTVKVWRLRQRVSRLRAELEKRGVPMKQFELRWVRFPNNSLDRLAERYQNARYKLAMAAVELAKWIPTGLCGGVRRRFPGDQPG